MKSVRIIPKLDIKGPNLVKGIHLEGLRVLGKPEDFAKHYYEKGADELIYMDVVASLYGRNSLHEIVSRTAKEIFIPLTVGGGLRTIEDIKNVLRAGADKVSLNTAAIKNPSIVREASRIFGSSTITVSIEAIKQPNGEYFAYTDNGREYTGIDVLSWAKKVEALGAGEILLTSIDREGTGNGYDIDLLKMITSSASIPIVACGGAGNLDHILQVIKDGKADAVCIASVLHYELIEKIKTTNNFKEEGNTEFLSSGRNFSKVELLNIDKIKKYLFQNHISCRYKNKN